MAKIQFVGTVKEVRVYGQYVILFLTATAPKRFRDRVLRFCVTGYNCNSPLKWAKLEIGAEVIISRTSYADNNNDAYYGLTITKSEVIDVNLDL